MTATHNSGTGERGGGLLSLLLTPFARCQSKTLVEQYRAGARLFDIRVRKHNDKWYYAHGLWRSRDTIYSALSQLSIEAYKAKEKAMLIPIPWLWAKFENARWSVKARRCKPTEYAMIDFV